jgi:ubiquinone/menaquinone biosynthesis C-methylase UbiE
MDADNFERYAMSSVAAPTFAADAGNADQVAYWNGPAGKFWTERQDAMDAVLAPVSASVVRTAAAKPGEHVIDVGCGCGATALDLAAEVGAQGSVLGIDISEDMLARARQRTPVGTPVTFLHADATVYPFKPASADILVSRFGVMFFAEPARAFANLRGALKAGGRVAFACWRAPKLNPYFMVPLMAAYKHVPRLPEVGPEDPGPFSFQSEERVQRIMADAGYRDVTMTAVDLTLDVARGNGLEAAVQNALEIGPAHRALMDQPETVRAAAAAEIRAALARAQAGQTVPLGAAIWVVGARN